MNFKELGENLGLNEDEYMELIELFIDTGTIDLQKLKTAMENGDSDEVGSAAHSLKGASGNLGLMDIFETARQCGEAARNHRMKDLPPLVKQIEGMMGTLSRAAGN